MLRSVLVTGKITGLALRISFAAVLAACVISCGEDEFGTGGQDLRGIGPCAGVWCSGHGTCYSEQGQAFCLCDSGYHAVDLTCSEVENYRGGLPVRGEFNGTLIVSIGEAEEGRGPNEVGMNLTEYPYDLGRYLAPGEAWCSEFVSWVYRVANDPFTGGYEGGWMLKGSTGVRSWFQNNAVWIENGGPEWATFEPAPGDYVRLTIAGGHSAIVRYVSGTSLYTVEGNISNQVVLYTTTNYKNDSSIDGFGHRINDNDPPTVNAGADQTVVHPNAASLQGTVDDDGLPDGTLTTTWSKLSGPGTVTFQDAESPQTSATFSAAGSYTLKLLADDGSLQSSDEVTVEALENQPPTANAGPDQTTMLPDGATLQGSVDDDGLPDGTLTTTWSKLSGPGTVTFQDAESPQTSATFSAAGSYTLKLLADDGSLQSSDEVTVEALENQPPTANAGPDQTTMLPDGATLQGSVDDDGLPDGTLTTTWSKLSGPGTVTFQDAESPQTSATFSAAGSYTLKLLADDGSLQSSDEVDVTVQSPPSVLGSCGCTNHQPGWPAPVLLIVLLLCRRFHRTAERLRRPTGDGGWL